MSTLVTFHAHPDDETIATGGVMALAARAGHRVIVISATDGAVGEVPDGFLDDGELLESRRSTELDAAAKLLGVSRVVRLGYRDSGMIGTDDNEHPDAFWQADLEQAAQAVAAVLVEERADVLTVYDDHGGYGHPDHIQVHRVGHRAAEIAGTPRVYEATINRDRVREMREHAPPTDDGPAAEEIDEDMIESIGLPEADLTAIVDVRSVALLKKDAMREHASQISEDSWFLAMDDDMFGEFFGYEWFRRTMPPVEPDDAIETAII